MFVRPCVCVSVCSTVLSNFPQSASSTYSPALTMPSGRLITPAHWSVFGNDGLSLAVSSHVVLVLCADWPHVTMVTSPLRIQCVKIEVDHVTQFLTFCVETSESLCRNLLI